MALSTIDLERERVGIDLNVVKKRKAGPMSCSVDQSICCSDAFGNGDGRRLDITVSFCSRESVKLVYNTKSSLLLLTYSISSFPSCGRGTALRKASPFALNDRLADL